MIEPQSWHIGPNNIVSGHGKKKRQSRKTPRSAENPKGRESKVALPYIFVSTQYVCNSFGITSVAAPSVRRIAARTPRGPPAAGGASVAIPVFVPARCRPLPYTAGQKSVGNGNSKAMAAAQGRGHAVQSIRTGGSVFKSGD